jgi:hypothetical protein
LVGSEGVEQLADALPGRLDGAFGDFAQHVLELREDLLDRVDVGTSGGKNGSLTPDGPDCLEHRPALPTA